jgi:TDG/mug DNA glycosylase family protein
MGLQDETIGETKIFVLPNPSGLNANYQAKALTDIFHELKRMAG